MDVKYATIYHMNFKNENENMLNPYENVILQQWSSKSLQTSH